MRFATGTLRAICSGKRLRRYPRPAEERRRDQRKRRRSAHRSRPRPIHHKTHLSTGGQTIHYTATAGNLLIRDEQDKPNGSIFYVAYTQDGVEAKNRPVTFFYNGGPGAPTIWLHMGSLGPVRVITESPEPTAPAPFSWVQNEYSLLDKSDLVFIDAPLCGFSRAVGKGTSKDFAGTDQDIKAFEKFIVRYITVNSRWNSPKFLFGESYGTTRSAGLVAALQEDGIEFNGVMLLSSILNYTVRNPGVRHRSGWLSSVLRRHRLSPQKGAEDRLHGRVGRAGTCVCPRTLRCRPAAGRPLARGRVRRDGAKVADFTGLSVAVRQGRKAPHLRRPASARSCCATMNEILGRYDARFEGCGRGCGGREPGLRSIRHRHQRRLCRLPFTTICRAI